MEHNPIERYTLGDGDAIVWSGEASYGASVLNWSDLFLIPFSLFWGGGTILFTCVVILELIVEPRPLLLAALLFLVPAAAFGAYLSVGRLVFKRWRQRNCHYAITSKRVLIAVAGKVRLVELSTVSRIDVVHRTRQGIGTIRLGSLPWWVRSRADDGLDIISLLRGTGVPTIWDIDNVDEVHALLRGRWVLARAGLR